MASNKIKVLVYPAGTEIGLEIGRQLKFSKHFKTIGASSIADHSQMVYDHAIFDIPTVTSDTLTPIIRQLCIDHAISFFIPAHDEASYRLADADLGPAKFIGPDPQIAKILRYKRCTYDTLAKLDSYLPKLYNKKEEVQDLPLFIKPNRGQGSVGTQLINSQREFDLLEWDSNHFIYSEYLPGNEYTVDCYTNFDGELIFTGARKRLRIKSGICVRAQEENNKIFTEIASQINEQLKLRGPWFFQCKEDKCGQLKLLEVSNRVSGTMGFQRLKGFNLIELALWEALGKKVDLKGNLSLPIIYDRAFMEDVIVDCEVDNVYVDLDDTLILSSGTINYELIGYLFGMRNIVGARIILITRHLNDPQQTLSGIALETLFDEIIHITDKTQKSFWISSSRPVFIDDSFLERKDVLETHPNAICIGLESQLLLKGIIKAHLLRHSPDEKTK